MSGGSGSGSRSGAAAVAAAAYPENRTARPGRRGGEGRQRGEADKGRREDHGASGTLEGRKTGPVCLWIE